MGCVQLSLDRMNILGEYSVYRNRSYGNLETLKSQENRLEYWIQSIHVNNHRNIVLLFPCRMPLNDYFDAVSELTVVLWTGCCVLYFVISVETEDLIRKSIDQQQPHTPAFNQEDGAGAARLNVLLAASAAAWRRVRAAGSSGRNRVY